MTSKMRKRKRAGSPSVVIPSLKKSGAESGAPPESVELLIRLAGIEDLKTYVVKIELADLKMFSEVESSCDHPRDHSNGDPRRFCNLKTSPRFLSALPDGCPASYVALLGSTIYSLFRRPVGGARLEFKSIDLYENPDLSEDEKWAALPPPPCEVDPLWPAETPSFPKLFSLRGRLYFVAAPHPVAFVFDPATVTWSKIDGPPGLNLVLSFKASLGEESGKLLFYHSNDMEPPPCDCSICIYDVVTRTWDVYPDTPFRNLFSYDKHIVGNALVNRQEPHTIYWLHKDLGKVFAFDWKNMRISSGPIIGMDHVYLYDMLKQSGNTSFCHLWGQIFCLFWSLGLSGATHIHLTFLRVVNNDALFLTAFVVGCRELTLPGSSIAYEASLLD